jgi:hypothetical protein
MKLRSIALRLQDMIEAIENLRLIIGDLPIADLKSSRRRAVILIAL